MLPKTTTAIDAIQAILAPAVLISAAALFLLGLNNRYVAIFSRIRHLNEERRQLEKELADCLSSQNQTCELEQKRVNSVGRQLQILLRMLWFLRNSILCHILAALCFVLTSLMIGLDFLLGTQVTTTLSLYSFMVGILFFLGGIVFLGVDILISYPVILVEIDSIENLRGKLGQ